MSEKNDIDLVELQWKVDSVVVNSVVVAIDFYYTSSVVVESPNDLYSSIVCSSEHE
mgnify:FL=1